MPFSLEFIIDDNKFLTEEFLRQCPGMTRYETKKYLKFSTQCKAIFTISQDEKGTVTYKTTDFGGKEISQEDIKGFLAISRNECKKYFKYFAKHNEPPVYAGEYTKERYSVGVLPAGVVKVEII